MNLYLHHRKHAAATGGFVAGILASLMRKGGALSGSVLTEQFFLRLYNPLGLHRIKLFLLTCKKKKKCFGR